MRMVNGCLFMVLAQSVRGLRDDRDVLRHYSQVYHPADSSAGWQELNGVVARMFPRKRRPVKPRSADRKASQRFSASDHPQSTEAQPMFEEADLIHRYTRADALRDGVLIDVSATAREAGIRWPVALTRTVWERCVRVPPGVVCQDEAGRLWDVLFLLRLAIGRSKGG